MYDLSLIRPTPVRELVRVGDANDGGYVIPRICLSRTDTLLSLGLGHNWSFDDQFAAASHAVVIGADGSLTTWSFVRRALQKFRHGVGYVVTLRLRKARERFARSADLVRWGRRFRAGSSGTASRIYRRYVSSKAGDEFIGIGELLSGGERKDGSVFLKMDIEGGEYEVLHEIRERAASFNGLAIEFHDLDTRGDEFSAGVRSLLDGFAIVHVHPNNNAGVIPGTGLPRTLEISFLNRSLLDRVTVRAELPEYPIRGLDAPCNGKRPELPLDFRRSA